jgi:hypothetical protein
MTRDPVGNAIGDPINSSILILKYKIWLFGLNVLLLLGLHMVNAMSTSKEKAFHCTKSALQYTIQSFAHL